MVSETTKSYLLKIVTQAAKELGFNLTKADIVFPDPKFGDYSTNAALVLAKEEKQAPAKLAKNFVQKIKGLDTQGVFSEISEAAGFVNFKLSHKYLLENLHEILNHKQLYGCSVLGGGKVVIVEYFQNNVAKPPHVGHLRSAVIGDCLLRILRSQGFRAISDTHIGDWGTQFGILLYAFKTIGDRAKVEKDPINELNKLYVTMSAKIEQNPSLRELGKQEFKKLEDGDVQNRQLWQWFVMVSMEDFERYRKLLGLLPFDHNLGESFYEDKMPKVLEEFRNKNLITVGETGEQYVDLSPHGLGRAILVKSDGATTYLLRDFATYIYRKKEFNFFKNLYVVDNRQAHHFRQLFKVLELAGYEGSKDSVHVDFGFMSLPEGAISTRKGTVISLQNLLDEAQKRALKIIQEKNPGLENKPAVAKEVALAAIKYFDLSHNRKTEIIFSWDKALSFEGNTGPYLQYTHARIYGILRKSQIQSAGLQTTTPKNFESEILKLKSEELLVLRKLHQYPEIVAQVAEDYMPNQLCNYLFELSQIFNNFYEEVPVLQETNEQLKNFRLQLITATAQVINNGLYLLGIEAPEEM